MTTIEDKIKLFSKIVFEKIQEEKEKEITIFEKEKEDILLKEKKRFEEREKLVLEEASKKANSKAKELIAKEKLEKQQAILSLKQRLIKETLLEVEHRIEEYVSSDEYEQYLLNCIRKASEGLEDGSYVIFVENRDIDRYVNSMEELLKTFIGKNFEIRPCSVNIIGGIILEEKGLRFRVDCSIRKKLQELTQDVGIHLSRRWEDV